MRWTLVLERVSENALNPDIARRHLRHVAAAAERNRSLAFRARIGKLTEPEVVLVDGQERKRYTVRLRLEESKARTEELAEERFRHVRGVVEKAARTKGWTIVAERAGQGQAEVPHVCEPRPPFVPVELTDEVIATHFGDVYGRDAHLRLLNDVIQTYHATGGSVKGHLLLHGPPGGAKTTLFEKLATLFNDSKHEHMAFIDASTMSKAGCERWIMERAEARILPEILVFEELEKVENKDAIMCLGSAMASGYLMRTNCRDGRVRVPTPFLVFATCNDPDLLSRFRNGYIWDRFVHRLYCPLPDEDTLYRILMDKVAAMGGRECWADLALELARVLGVRTPRRVIGFLTGRHRLEDGSFQQDVLSVEEAARLDELEVA